MKWQSNIWLIWKDLLKFSTLCLSLFLTEFLQCKKIWLDISYDFLFSADFFLPYLEHCGASEASGSILQDHLSFFCYLVKNLSRKVVSGGWNIGITYRDTLLFTVFGFQRKGGNKEVNMLKNSSTQGVLKIFPFLVCYTKNSSYRNNF